MGILGANQRFPLKIVSICAPQARKKMEISKPYFQISLKFEKSQNHILNFRENMKNLKTLMQDSKLEFSKSQNHESQGVTPRGVPDLVSFGQIQCNLQWEINGNSPKIWKPQSRWGMPVWGDLKSKF